MGVWHASEVEELYDEIRLNGYKVKQIETVYAASATLVIAGLRI